MPRTNACAMTSWWTGGAVVAAALPLLLLAPACDDDAEVDDDDSAVEDPWECVIPEEETEPEYTNVVGCWDDFDKVGARPLDGSIPGAVSAKTVIDQASDNTLYFQNSEIYEMHYYFCFEHLNGDGLPPIGDISTFNATEYYSPSRRFILGAVTYYEEPATWTYEISPYDTASAEMIETAFTLIKENAYFGDDLYFHPTSSTVEAVAEDLPDWIPVITTDELFEDITYQPLNLGESYGQLRFFTSEELQTEYVGPRDVVVLDKVPNDISVVAGLMTAELQTPLSHVNVLSQNRGTPNMALRGAFDNEDLRALEDGWVHFVVDAFEYVVEEATQAEADAWWEEHAPEPVNIPEMDLSVTELAHVETLDPTDVSAYGAKTCNYGVLYNIGDPVPVRPGFGIPFYYYVQFMEDNGFADQVAALMADDQFNNDPSYREEALTALREAMIAAPIDPTLETMVIDKLNSEYPGTRMRFRSSTNAEDLETYSGAGLYTSMSGDPSDPERPVDLAIKTVWAAIWNFRAFEERTYNSIPHDGVGMAVLVHPSYIDEEANGVALTNNIFDETQPGFYINVQVGEYSVVEPEFGVTVDAFLYYYYYPGQPITYFSYSNLTPSGTTVLTSAQIYELGQALDAIHTAFVDWYYNAGTFYAMDVEFKFDDLDSGGEPTLWVKQARPHPGWAADD